MTYYYMVEAMYMSRTHREGYGPGHSCFMLENTLEVDTGNHT